MSLFLNNQSPMRCLVLCCCCSTGKDPWLCVRPSTSPATRLTAQVRVACCAESRQRYVQRVCSQQLLSAQSLPQPACSSPCFFLARHSHRRLPTTITPGGYGPSDRPFFIPAHQAPLLALTVDVARGWQLPVEVFKVEMVVGAASGPAAGQPRTYYLVQSDLFR